MLQGWSVMSVLSVLAATEEGHEHRRNGKWPGWWGEIPTSGACCRTDVAWRADAPIPGSQRDHLRRRGICDPWVAFQDQPNGAGPYRLQAPRCRRSTNSLRSMRQRRTRRHVLVGRAGQLARLATRIW